MRPRLTIGGAQLLRGRCISLLVWNHAPLRGCSLPVRHHVGSRWSPDRGTVTDGSTLYCSAWAQRCERVGEEMRERTYALRHQRGQGFVEYALLILFMAIAVFAILVFLGPAIGTIFSNIKPAL
jgi:Flp pilus assembly pilin Flp